MSTYSGSGSGSVGRVKIDWLGLANWLDYVYRYSIRVGRSTSVHGPFVDRDNKDLLDGGGTVVYGSNHGKVYAPGGLGVLPGANGEPDVLYYHYRRLPLPGRSKAGLLTSSYRQCQYRLRPRCT
jgi:hypothetical protein